MSRPVARKKLVWRTLWESGSSGDIVVPATGIQANFTRTLITEAEVEDLDDEATLLRVVGEFQWFAWNDTTAVDLPMVVTAGMLVREEIDASSNTPDMMSPDAIEEYPWMWIRTWTGLPDLVSAQIQHDCADSLSDAGAIEKFDVRVKRKLRNGDQLMFYFTARLVAYGTHALPAAAGLNVASWMRVRILLEA